MTTLFHPNQRPKTNGTQTMIKQGKIPAQNKYHHGYRWCGKCGEWRNVGLINYAVRCDECNYMLRKFPLLRGSGTRRKEVVRF